MKQIIMVAKSCAELVHYALNWEEPMTGDDIKLFVNRLELELKELNGEG